MSAVRPPDERMVRIMYAVLFAGCLAMSGLLIGFRALAGGSDTGDEGAMGLFTFRAVALFLVLAGTVATRVVRNMLPARRAGMAFTEWWTQGGAKAPIIWGVAEGTGILGAMLYAMTGDALTLALPFLWSIVVFVTNPPHRLSGG